MNGHGEKLTRRQEFAIVALLENDSIREAATQAGVADSTLRRWMQLPAFRRAFREAKSDLVEVSTRRLLRFMNTAAAKLEKIMNDPQAPLAVQLSAAVKILERGSDANWEQNIQSRIEELERQQRERP